jgi:hypothetical protein
VTAVRDDGWPQARLDGLARLRVLAAGLPGTFLHERHLDHPVDDVWAVAADLEGAVPRYEPDVSSLRIRRRDGDRLDVVAHGPWWMGKRPVGFDVELRHGWCWMVARRPQVYVVGMAAEPEGEGTRFGHLEGVVLPSPRWAAPAVRPLLALSRFRHRHHVPHDVDGIVRLLEGG